MDTTSHGLWSYLIWKQHPAILLAIFFGVMPDVLSFAPRIVYNALKGRWGRIQSVDNPSWITKYCDFMFPITHSLVLAVATSLLVWGVWGFQWWILAWPLHVLIDVPTHKKTHATPFLWPLSGTKVHGYHWQKSTFMITNYVLLAVAYGVFVFF